jgi:putative membrane protein
VTDLAGGDSTRANPATKLAVDRTRLAFERTTLSWVRTAISLISFGFSIPQFFRIARTGLPESKDLIGPDEFGLLLIVIGLLALLIVTLEHRASIEALKAQYPVREGYQTIPRSRASMLAGLIAVLGLLALVSILLRKLSLII